jgi:hypothetical protein
VLLDETLLDEMENVMHAKFQKYWANSNIVMLICTIIDLSMKTEFVKFYFYIVGENVDVKLGNLKMYLKKYYLEYEKIMRSHVCMYLFCPRIE